MRKVLIAAPLRQDPKIFREYQKGLDGLIIPTTYRSTGFLL